MKFLLEFNNFTDLDRMSKDVLNDIKKSVENFLLNYDIEEYKVTELELIINFYNERVVAIKPTDRHLGVDMFNIPNAIGVPYDHELPKITKDQLEHLQRMLNTLGSFKIIKIPGFAFVITSKKLNYLFDKILEFQSIIKDSYSEFEFFGLYTKKYEKIFDLKSGHKQEEYTTSLSIQPTKQNYIALRLEFKLDEDFNFHTLPENGIIEFECDSLITGRKDLIPVTLFYLFKNLEKIEEKINKKNLVYRYNIYNSYDENIEELLKWLDNNVFYFFKDDHVNKLENFLKVVDDISKEKDIKIDINNQDFSNDFIMLEVFVKYKEVEEQNLFFYYYTNSDKIIIKDENMKEIIETNINDLYDDLLLYLIS